MRIYIRTRPCSDPIHGPHGPRRRARARVRGAPNQGATGNTYVRGHGRAAAGAYVYARALHEPRTRADQESIRRPSCFRSGVRMDVARRAGRAGGGDLPCDWRACSLPGDTAGEAQGPTYVGHVVRRRSPAPRQADQTSRPAVHPASRSRPLPATTIR
jgi:hypothetical protein